MDKKIAIRYLICLFCLSFVLSGYAQEKRQKTYVHASAGFFRGSTNSDNITNTPFMLDFKIGGFLGDKDVIGLQISTSTQSIPTKGTTRSVYIADFGLPETYGRLTHKYTAVGMFYDHFFSIGKKIDIFPSAYLQYLEYRAEDKGNIIVVTDSSRTYLNKIENSFKGRVGINLNLQYALNKSTSVTLRFVQFDCKLWDHTKQNLSLEMPLLVGVRWILR